MADYIIRPAFLTAYTAAFATLNKDYSAGEEAYDKAYDTLNRLFFPYLGETEEHREQWIKLVHAFFSETQGGFWYVDKDFKEKDIYINHLLNELEFLRRQFQNLNKSSG